MVFSLLATIDSCLLSKFMKFVSTDDKDGHHKIATTNSFGFLITFVFTMLHRSALARLQRQLERALAIDGNRFCD